MFDIFSKKRNSQHFFLFANSNKCENIHKYLLSDHNFNSDNSVVVLFNMGLPLTHYQSVADHPHKWIFFRMLGNPQNNGSIFRDLSLLNTYRFDKFFFIPDFLDPNTRVRLRYRQPFYNSTIDYLVDHHIDIDRLSHIGLFDPDILAATKKLYTENKTISSGLWIYLYLKGKYPKSTFTLLGYSAEISEQYHDPSFEKAFLLSQILSNQCDCLSCFNRP